LQHRGCCLPALARLRGVFLALARLRGAVRHRLSCSLIRCAKRSSARTAPRPPARPVRAAHRAHPAPSPGLDRWRVAV